jgi:hypothetical protein
MVHFEIVKDHLCRFNEGKIGKEVFLKRGLRAGEPLRQEGFPGGVRVQFETGRLASLADGSCLLQIGDTHVLATVSVANQNQYVQRRQNFSLPLQGLLVLWYVGVGWKEREVGGFLYPVCASGMEGGSR